MYGGARLKTDFSSWRSIITFLYLFHFRSLLRLTFLLSPNKQNEKLNFGLPIETKSRMLARLLRSRQHSGQSLSFCGEARFDKTWRRSSVNKVKLGGSGIKKKGGWQRRIDAFCDVWLGSGSRRQNPTHALSGQSNRGKFLSLGNSWRQKKKAWLRQWSGVSELGGQRDGQQRRAGVLLSLLFRVWRWISFFCFWIGWPPAS